MLAMKGHIQVVFLFNITVMVHFCWFIIIVGILFCYLRCLAVSPNFEIAKNNMAIALTDLGTKVSYLSQSASYMF